MVLGKVDGAAWGAAISFYHKGGAVIVDVGMCAHLGETYRWCTIKNHPIPLHDVATQISVPVSGIWSPAGIPPGRDISAQVCVAPAGILPSNNEETPKMDSHLNDVNAILERTYGSVYRTEGLAAKLTIRVTNKNAPPNAAYWCGLTDRTILSGPFTPITQKFEWTIFEDELTVFMCFDAGYSLIDTPNSSQFLGWGPFIDGKFYTWDFATGQLEGPFDEEPPPPPPPPEGLQLVAGWNNVAYTGPSQAIESAVASIMPYLVQISVYRQGVYHDYYPADPAGSTLSYLNNGEACWVEVTQDCFWSW